VKHATPRKYLFSSGKRMPLFRWNGVESNQERLGYTVRCSQRRPRNRRTAVNHAFGTKATAAPVADGSNSPAHPRNSKLGRTLQNSRCHDDGIASSAVGPASRQRKAASFGFGRGVRLFRCGSSLAAKYKKPIGSGVRAQGNYPTRGRWRPAKRV
jgi:hypothetical protein